MTKFSSVQSKVEEKQNKTKTKQKPKVMNSLEQVILGGIFSEHIDSNVAEISSALDACASIDARAREAFCAALRGRNGQVLECLANSEQFMHVFATDSKVQDTSLELLSHVIHTVCSQSSTSDTHTAADTAADTAAVARSDESVTLHKLSIGIAALQLYMRANWTGPPLPKSTWACTFLPSAEYTEWNSRAHHLLELCGEDTPVSIRVPWMLVFAHAIFVGSFDSIKEAMPTLASVWRCRYAVAHQASLNEHVADLRDVVLADCAVLVKAVSGTSVEQIKATYQHQAYASMFADSKSTVIIEPDNAEQDATDDASSDNPVVWDAPAAANWTREAAAIALTEASNGFQRYWQQDEARGCLRRASCILGLEVNLTGALGKRTKYQAEAKSQLILQVKDSLGPASDQHRMTDSQLAQMPDTQILVDETLLPQTAYEEDLQVYPLRQASQLVLAGLTADLIRSSPSHADIVDDEIIAHTSHLLHEHMFAFSTWAVQSFALHARSRIEMYDSKRVERGFCQMETLSFVTRPSTVTAWAGAKQVIAEEDEAAANANVDSSANGGGAADAHDDAAVAAAVAVAEAVEDSNTTTDDEVDGPAGTSKLGQISAPSSDPLEEAAAFRAHNLFASPVQPTWDMLDGLAREYIRMAMVSSAVNLYEVLGTWDRAVECYITMGRMSDAEAKLLDLLESDKAKHPNYRARMIVMLGDVRNDPELYSEAWEVSEHKYAKAQRRLALHYFGLEEFKQCAEHCELALAINAIDKVEWFRLGHCGTRMDDWKLTVRAFSRVVSIDPEYGDAWNNLAAAHLHLEEHESAFHALEQAVRFNERSWKTWDNYMTCAIHLGNFQQAVYALGKVVQFKSEAKHSHIKDTDIKSIVDSTVLVVLTNFVLKHVEAGTNPHLVMRFVQVLTDVSNRVPRSPHAWQALGRICVARGDMERAIEYYEKQLRALDSIPWLEETDSLMQYCDAVIATAEAYINDTQGKSSLMAARMMLENTRTKIMQSSATAIAEHAVIAQLEELLKRVEDARDTRRAARRANQSTASSSDSSGASRSIHGSFLDAYR
jgi:tetratricopeptide (TPR) repeat protein